MKINTNQSNHIVAIDVGTTKICVLVAKAIGADNLEILGIGKSPSLGMARGVVVDIQQAVHSITLAIREAELMSGIKIESAYIGISGSHIQSINSHGMIPIKNGQIKEYDILTVLASARAISLPEGHQILHAFPKYYSIDSQQKILNPLGMFGVRLEAQVHIITGKVTCIQNLIQCCQMAGINVIDLVLEPVASAKAVLTADEITLGVGMLDIGGGTSDFAIYQNGTIRHTKIFPIAGNLITNDIALCLRTTVKDAQRLKHEFGSTLTTEYNHEITAQTLHGDFDQIIYENDLLEIIEPRVQELLLMLKKNIDENELSNLMPSGLVLTGGGALLKGLPTTAQKILNMPVRIGKPQIINEFKSSLENPIYATGYGLLLYIIKNQNESNIDQLTGPLITRIFWRMKSWIADFF